MENWKEPFLWILLQRYKAYVEGDKEKNIKPGLHEPEEVLKYTHSYRLNNNIFVEFIDEAIVDDDDGFITVADLYAEFKEWFRESHNLKPPPKKDFQAGIERELGSPEAMFVEQSQQTNSGEETDQKKRKRRPRKMGWKGYALQGETHSDEEI